MPGSLPKELLDFMQEYGVESHEIWEVRNGAYAIKHKALERVAAQQRISFDPPMIIEADGKTQTVAICVTARMGDRVEWSIGEASPKNTKNAYCYAMAEKRGKDRATLKLLQTHGVIYSEAEADEMNSTERLAKKDAGEIYKKLQNEIREAVSREQLRKWGEGNADRIHRLPEDWETTLRNQYEEQLGDLANRERANGGDRYGL